MEKLTLRDQFAMSALQGLLANNLYMKHYLAFQYDPIDFAITTEIYVTEAYAFADEMIKARK